jgi:hypothetical protein
MHLAALAEDASEVRAEVHMHLTLTREEGRLLLRHLTQHIEHLDADLVHTDRRELQHALALEIDQLRGLATRLRAAHEQEPTPEIV